jgi:hypothetical protein
MKRNYVVLLISFLGVVGYIALPSLSSAIFFIYIIISIFISIRLGQVPTGSTSPVVTKTKILAVSSLRDISIDNGTTFIHTLTTKRQCGLSHS